MTALPAGMLVRSASRTKMAGLASKGDGRMKKLHVDRDNRKSAIQHHVCNLCNIQDSNGGRRRQSTHRISREDNTYCLLTACYAIALLYPKMEVSACTQQAVTLVEDKALSWSLVVN